MKRRLLLALFFLSFIGYAQQTGITVSTTAYTPQQLMSQVVINSECLPISNFSSQGPTGIGYFTSAPGNNFPFTEGMVIRSGQATATAGQYSGNNLSTSGSGSGDADLQAVSNANGVSGQITDASFVKFDFVPLQQNISFDFVFASNEYGTYQCQYGDVFAFILKDLSTGASMNLGVIPGTTTPVSVVTIRDNAANGSCPSVNPSFFDRYNVDIPALSNINMRGQTVPMTASASVIPGHQYSLKIVIGDYMDPQFDSAVFIKANSFMASAECVDNIRMVAFSDTNTNGTKDAGEPEFTHGSFLYDLNDSGTNNEVVSSTGTSLLIPGNGTDSYDLNYQIYPEFASYYSVSASYTNVTVVPGSGSNFYYFPVTLTQPYTDVSLALIPLSSPRAGMANTTRMRYTNNGATVASGTLTYTKAAEATITNISQSGVTETATGFTYNYTNLQPFETRTIDITLQTPNIPVVNINDILTSSASITANIDIHIEDNETTMDEIVIGSYDPNDIVEAHGPQILVADFGSDDYLEYTIRFQNSGTASALTVKVDDVLDEMLDETSVRMVAASHNYVLSRTGNQLSWKFSNINLPAESVDEPGSHGYIQFRIKPKAGYAAGDIIPNSAAIYFDTNPAIVTNTFDTAFVNALEQPEFDVKKISLYPNPARATVTISLPAGSETISQVKVTDLTGKTVLGNESLAAQTINISELAKGVYFVEITLSSREKTVRRLLVD